MKSSTQNFFEGIGLFAASLFLFTWGVNGQEIISFDSRFYLFALEMWRHGPSWFPTTYHQPYPDYPATSTLLIFITAKLLGGLNKLTAVIPSAIAAAGTIVLTYKIGALHNKRWGFCAVCCLLLTIVFFKSARSISLDMFVTLITTWCFYLIYSAHENQYFQKVGWVFPLLLLGFMFRGPVGLIIPTGVICTYYLLNRNMHEVFFYGLFSFVILCCVSLAFLAIAHHVGDDHFVHEVLNMQAFGRMDEGDLPWSFYLTHGIKDFVISFPLAIAASLGSLYYLWRLRKFRPETELKLVVKLIGWVLVILIGMSVPGDKKIRYILPIAPALALIAAYPFSTSAKETYFRLLYGLFLTFFMIIPAALLIAWGMFLSHLSKNALHSELQYEWMMPVLMSLQVVNVLAFLFLSPKKPWRDGLITLFSTVSFVVVYISVVEPIEMFIERSQEVVVMSETLRNKMHADLVFYKEHPDGLPIKYVIHMRTEEHPIFVTDVMGLEMYSRPAIFVARESNFNSIPAPLMHRYRVIARDTMGHVSVVIFTNR